MVTLATFARVCVSDLDAALRLLGGPDPSPPRLPFGAVVEDVQWTAEVRRRAGV